MWFRRPSRPGSPEARDEPAAPPREADTVADHSAEHRVTLVTRTGCHLCQDAEQVLRRLAGELGFALQELDVDRDPDLLAEYSDRVPVVLIDGREHGYWRVEEQRFRTALRRPPRVAREG